jgi:hypothetical protein
MSAEQPDVLANAYAEVDRVRADRRQTTYARSSAHLRAANSQETLRLWPTARRSASTLEDTIGGKYREEALALDRAGAMCTATRQSGAIGQVFDPTTSREAEAARRSATTSRSAAASAPHRRQFAMHRHVVSAVLQRWLDDHTRYQSRSRSRPSARQAQDQVQARTDRIVGKSPAPIIGYAKRQTARRRAMSVKGEGRPHGALRHQPRHLPRHRRRISAAPLQRLQVTCGADDAAGGLPERHAGGRHLDLQRQRPRQRHQDGDGDPRQASAVGAPVSPLRCSAAAIRSGRPIRPSQLIEHAAPTTEACCRAASPATTFDSVERWMS